MVALLLTCYLIGWLFSGAFTICDDLGIEWGFARDSPAAIARAAAESVARWRFRMAADALSLVPDDCDAGAEGKVHVFDAPEWQEIQCPLDP